MDIDLKQLDAGVYRTVARIGRIADRHHVRAFIVGGIVRDLILPERTRILTLWWRGMPFCWLSRSPAN
jgi:hypothetical protein